MAALNAERDTQARQVSWGGDVYHYPVAASTTVFAGAIVMIDASGNAIEGATATGQIAVGRCENTVNNDSGSAGDFDVEIRTGIFAYENSGGDPVTVADIGNDVFIEDDQTVSRTNGGATQSRAGVMVGLRSDGQVEVAFSFPLD